MIRCAVIGFGGYGWSLVEKLKGLEDQLGCKLVAAADLRPSAVPEKVQLLEQWGVEIFDDVPRMLSQLKGRCDIVYIATSIHSHLPLAVMVMEGGFHVHLEKPPAATVQEVDEMIATSHRLERICLVGFQAVHGGDLRTIKARLSAGKLGKLRSLACAAGWPRGNDYYGRNNWAGRLKAGEHWVLDGPATNALAHQTHNMLFLAGATLRDVATPLAARGELYAARAEIDSHDTAAIALRTAEGPSTLLLVSHCSQETIHPIITVDATGGTVKWEMGKGGVIQYANGAIEAIPPDKDPVAPMLANLIQAVREKDPSLIRCTLADARQPMLAFNGAYESSRRIHRIAKEFTRPQAEGTPKERIVIDGMDDLLRQGLAQGKLFSDLPNPPAWVQAGEWFDLTGYARFPQQFQAES